jgi:hypothetical protein
MKIELDSAAAKGGKIPGIRTPIVLDGAPWPGFHAALRSAPRALRRAKFPKISPCEVNFPSCLPGIALERRGICIAFHGRAKTGA